MCKDLPCCRRGAPPWPTSGLSGWTPRVRPSNRTAPCTRRRGNRRGRIRGQHSERGCKPCYTVACAVGGSVLTNRGRGRLSNGCDVTGRSCSLMSLYRPLLEYVRDTIRICARWASVRTLVLLRVMAPTAKRAIRVSGPPFSPLLSRELSAATWTSHRYSGEDGRIFHGYASS